MKRTQSILRSLVACSLAFGCFAIGASGQEPDKGVPEVVSKPPEIVSARERSILMQRERRGLHPGRPLDVSGLEEGDNDFRARTPILQQSTRTPTLVDRDENRRRRLAMYYGGERFNAPLPLAVASAGTIRSAPRVEPVVEEPVTPATAEERSTAWQWIFTVLGAGVAAAILLWRSVKT